VVAERTTESTEKPKTSRTQPVDQFWGSSLLFFFFFWLCRSRAPVASLAAFGVAYIIGVFGFCVFYIRTHRTHHTMKLVLKRLLPALFVLTVLFQVILPQVSAVGVAPAKNEVDDEALPEVEESLAGAGLLFLIALLMIAFMVGYVLREIKFAYLHESGAAMIIGLVAGLLVRTLNNTSTLKSVVAFDKHFFFLVLLPPIIFESGYNMRRVRIFITRAANLLFSRSVLSFPCHEPPEALYPQSKR
jgi:hypothetical protein